MHRTAKALTLEDGYIDTDGLYSFIPCAQAFFGPCEVEVQINVAKLLNDQMELLNLTPFNRALNPE